MKKVIFIALMISFLLTGFSFYKVSTLNKKITQMEKENVSIAKKLDKELELVDKLQTTISEKENELVESKKSLDEKNKEVTNLKTENEKLNNNSEPVTVRNNEVSNSYHNDSVYTEPVTEAYNNDPVAERDALAQQFESEHGRPPSSGEVQMDWLKKQGLVE